jgi:hypothetical protein
VGLEALIELLYWLLPWALGVIVGVVVATVTGVMSIVGRRVPAGLASAGVFIALSAGATTATVAHLMADGGAADNAFEMLLVANLVRFANWLGVGLAAVIALILLAVAGARGQPKQVKWAALGFGGCLIVAIVTVVGGVVYDNAIFAVVRGVSYAFCGVLVGSAMLCGGGSEGNGAHIGGAAAVIFSMFVAASETAEVGMAKLLLLQGLGTVDPGSRAEVVDGYLAAIVSTEWPWQMATIVLAGLVGLLGVACASRDKVDAGALAGALWIVAGWWLWLGGDPSREAIVLAAAALPSP